LTNEYALRWACIKNRLEIIHLFMEFPHLKLKVVLFSSSGLMIACEYGHLELTKFLLSIGADPTANESCSVRMASHNGHLEIIEILLQDGRADPAVRNNWPIKRASENGHSDVVEALLQDGRADPAVNYNSPIRWASCYGHKEIVKALLQDGRCNPTDDAIENAKTEEIKELLIKYRYRVDGEEYCRAKEIFR
jgi:ankyrin repeat protein